MERFFRMYLNGQITRREFIARFGDWQRGNGIDFTCYGTGDRDGLYVTYRGVKARIADGCLAWKGGRAKSVETFKRKIDIAKAV